MDTLLRVALGNAVVAVLLAVAAALVGMFARRHPALRHGLWLLVLIKLLTPPLWTVPVAWVGGPREPAALASPEHAPEAKILVLEESPGPEVLPGDAPQAVETRAEAAVEPSVEQVRRLWPWKPWILVLWGAGSLAAFGVAAWRIRQFGHILTLAEPGSKELSDQVEAMAATLGLRRTPSVWWLPGAVSPMVWAVGCRPRLIVPRKLWARLDEAQQATLLAHELAHLKRRDHWVRCLELVVTGLYWWLPVVWIARRALREAEEQCCDAWVVWTFPDDPRTYAEALLETLDFLSGAGPAAVVAASGLSPVHHLKRRMTMIMQGTTPRALTWNGMLAVLGLSAILLPLSPTWAQQRLGPEEEFFNALKQNHEFNDPRWPFLVKAKDVQDKTLIDATFKHRAQGSDDPNRFDMIVQAKTAEIQFDAEKGIARVHLDGAEVANPREGTDLQAPVLEIPIPTSSPAPDVNDKEAASAEDDEPDARDPGPRPKRPGEQAAESQKMYRVLVEGREGEAAAKAAQEKQAALEKLLAELKALTARKAAGEALDEREREVLKRAIDRLQASLKSGRPEPKPRTAIVLRKSENIVDDNPEAKKEPAESAERRADIARLKAEVAERHKALMEAQQRLAKAVRQLEGAGAAARAQRFDLEVRNLRHALPALPGPEAMRPIGPMPPGPEAMRPVGPRFQPRPDQDKRIAELEERLEMLQNEVKSLKKDSPEKK